MLSLFWQILDIRDDERARMAVLLSAAFFLGFSLILFYTASSAIFLSEYATDLLPQANILNALVVISLSVVYSASEKRLGFLRLLYTTIAILALSAIGFWVLLAFAPSPTIKFLVMAWYRTLFIFGSIGLWEIAARLLNIQEAKRLFAVLSAAMMFAIIVGGLTATPLVQLLGATHDLLIVSALGLLLYTLHLMRSLPRFRTLLEHRRTSEVATMTLRDVLRNRYIVLFFALKIAAVMVANVLEFVFYRQAAAQFATEASLASFIGLFTSLMTFFTLTLSALLAGRFVARFGLRVALPLHPALVTLGSGVALAVSLATSVGSFAFFAVLAVVRLSDGVLFGAVSSPVMAMLYQPLKASERAWVRVQSEGKLGSVALILSGLMLLVFQVFPAIPPIFYVVLLLGLGLLWFFVALRTYRDYAQLLVESVRNVFLRQNMMASAVEIGTDGDSLSGGRSLGSGKMPILREMLNHPEMDVKLSTLNYIQQERLVALLPLVEAAIKNPEQPTLVRTTALRTWCELVGDEVAVPFLNDMLGDSLLYTDALALLLNRGHGVSHLERLVRSEQVEERLQGVEVLSHVTNLPDYVRLLLSDKDERVVQGAIHAAGNHLEFLAHAIFPLIRHDVYRLHIIKALSRPESLPFIAQRLKTTPNLKTQRVLLEIAGNIPHPDTETLLQPHWQASHPFVRLWALRSLNRLPITKTYLIDGVVAKEIAIATEIFHIMIDAKPASLLMRALEDELQAVRERVFRLYALAYPREMVWGAYENWQRGNRTNNHELIGYALEGLFVVLSHEHRKCLFALLERIPVEERLKRLEVPTHHQSAEAHYRALLQPFETIWASDWTRACVWSVLYENKAIQTHEGFSFLRGMITLEGEGKMFSIFEKVEILRNVSIFSQTPDGVLAEVARILQRQTFESGATIIHEDELGTRMYLLVEGRVHVHRHGQTLNHMEAPEIFGELSVLDAAPRVASVTAMSEVTVFILEREPLYQLMSTRPEIMEGVMRVLCQRVRHSVTV